MDNHSRWDPMKGKAEEWRAIAEQRLKDGELKPGTIVVGAVALGLLAAGAGYWVSKAREKKSEPAAPVR